MSALGMCVLTFACVKWCLVKFRAVFNLLFDTLLTYLTHCCTYQQDTIFFSFSQCILIMTDVNPPLQNAQINTWIIPYREGKDGKVHSCTHTHTHTQRSWSVADFCAKVLHPSCDSLQLWTSCKRFLTTREKVIWYTVWCVFSFKKHECHWMVNCELTSSSVTWTGSPLSIIVLLSSSCSIL